MAALVLLAVAVLPPGVLTSLLPYRARSAYWRLAARGTLAALGLRLRVGHVLPRPARLPRGVLIVANHISFFDVLAIAAIAPARFVAKCEVTAMGPAAPLLRVFGILEHRRGDLGALRPFLSRVAVLLRRGRRVAVFPEGTTWCGVASGRFRPAFFQAAIDAGVPVLPIAIAYQRAGNTVTAPGYLGDDDLADTFGRVLRAANLTVAVTVHPLQAPEVDRRTLAARAQMLIHPPAALSWTRSCLSTSTMPPPRRWSPRPSRR